jgi:hypothetical protein
VAGDFDGDGLDEVLIAVVTNTTISLRIMDYGATNKQSWEVRNFTHTATVNALGAIGLAAGDLDGDGRDEAIFSLGNRIYLLGDLNDSFSQKALIEAPAGITLSYVACADYDQDGLDEWVLTLGNTRSSNNIGTYTIYDDYNAGGGQTVLKTGQLNTGNASSAIPFGWIATGDFDGDGLPETAFTGSSLATTSTANVLILDTEMDNVSRPVFSFLCYKSWYTILTTYVVAGDMDNDGKAEIAAGPYIFRLNAEKTALDQVADVSATTGGSYCNPDAMGDVTGDKRQDVLYITSAGLHVVSWTGGSITTKNLGAIGGAPTLCLPNVDSDSYVLEFIGHDLRFTDPIVHAVIASPPYFEGANNGNGSTTFGQTRSSGQTVTDKGGFKVGLSLGVQTKISALFIQISSATVKATVENSFTWGSSHSKEITETWAYSTGVGEDKVVFTAIPFDSYYYTVISAPEGEAIGGGNDLAPGDTMVVSVPRKPGTYNTTVAAYNANNGDGYDITLKHTLGTPFSYYTHAEISALKTAAGNRGLFTTTTEMRVGNTNTGSTSKSVEQVTTEEKIEGYELEISAEAEIVAGVVLVGASAAYNTGYEITNSVSEGIFIEGAVPDIPLAQSSYEHFRWGLLMFPVEEQNQKFNVVTYWVDH